MNVKQLIDELLKMDQESQVKYVWDGSARSRVRFIWKSNSGDVILCDHGEYVSDNEEKPIGYNINNVYETPWIDSSELL